MLAALRATQVGRGAMIPRLPTQSVETNISADCQTTLTVSVSTPSSEAFIT